MNAAFLLQNALLGVGLAMDAFSVSLANGLTEPRMRKVKACQIAFLFAAFQAAMPLIGYCLVRFFVEHFHAFRLYIPYIALILLLWIGGKMLLEGLRPAAKREGETPLEKKIGIGTLMIQGIATSIDALSVGFTIAEYSWQNALIAAGIIAFVTFVICLGGVWLGKKFGTKLSEKASILGGVILILIGLEIFLSSLFS